jgi:tRNA(Ile)-lysidine synthase
VNTNYDKVLQLLSKLKGKNIALACSGGRDSVVLLHLCIHSGLSPDILHVNFGLRGKESQAEEAFVKALATKFNVKVKIRQVTPDELNPKDAGIQEKARNLRYNWFGTLRYQHILVAHHAQDNAETLLLNGIRGAGLTGMSGMNDGFTENSLILRPLLGLSSNHIQKYAGKYNLEWCEDSSNKSSKYNRNRIRINVLPELEKINPEAAMHLAETAEILGEYKQWIDDITETYKNKYLDGNQLLLPKEITSKPYITSLLYELLKGFNITRQQVTTLSTVLHAPGKKIQTGKHCISVTGQGLLITLEKPEHAEDRMIYFKLTEGEIKWGEQGTIIIKQLPDNNIPKANGKNSILLELQENSLLCLRAARKGERMQSFGMKGTQLLSDLFTNAKVYSSQRHKYPVLEFQNKILWLAGIRSSEHTRTKKNHNNVFFLEYKFGNSN